VKLLDAPLPPAGVLPLRTGTLIALLLLLLLLGEGSTPAPGKGVGVGEGDAEFDRAVWKREGAAEDALLPGSKD